MLTLQSLPSTTTSLSSRLRTETREAHRAAERSPLLRRLLRRELSREEYASYLAALARVYRALEEGLRRHRELPALAPLVWPALWRSEALSGDLAALLGAGWEARIAEDRAADAYVARLEGLVAEEPTLLVAHVYTRYLGDLSGGQILRGAAAALAPEALGFYAFPQLGDLDAARASFRVRLDALPLSPRVEGAIVAEARVAFALSAGLMDAIVEPPVAGLT